jgi:hypothetical protein
MTMIAGADFLKMENINEQDLESVADRINLNMSQNRS